MPRRWAAIAFVLASLLNLPVRAGEVIDPAKAKTEAGDPTLWYDVRLLGLEGQGWTDTKAPFDRLPAKAEGVVRPPVWHLSRQSAGLAVRFATSAKSIKARWTLTSDQLAMNHMPATGVSGLDLYARGDDGKWHWLAVGRPSAVTNSAVLISNLPDGPREYILYLPLYNGVKSLEIGLAPGVALEKPAPRPESHRKPIVVYGTSITQGGCASRPGMVYTAIIGRHLERPVINLGFSGSGTMDPSMAELLGELDAAVFVIDCLPNMTSDQTAERTEPLVRTIRRARPDTPIVLVEDRNYPAGALLKGTRERNEASHAALHAAYDRLVAAGVKQLYYLPGADQIGIDGEGTVDGSHPTDLGFARMAKAFEAVLRPILENGSK